MSDVSYRTGRSWGVTVVRQKGENPGDDDELVGMMRTQEDADLVVTALNAWTAVSPEELGQIKERLDSEPRRRTIHVVFTVNGSVQDVDEFECSRAVSSLAGESSPLGSVIIFVGGWHVKQQRPVRAVSYRNVEVIYDYTGERG